MKRQKQLVFTTLAVAMACLLTGCVESNPKIEHTIPYHSTATTTTTTTTTSTTPTVITTEETLPQTTTLKTNETEGVTTTTSSEEETETQTTSVTTTVTQTEETEETSITQDTTQTVYSTEASSTLEASTAKETTLQTTASVTTVSTTVATTKVISGEIKNLPNSLQQVIDKYKKMYPNMKVGAGVFTLNGSGGYGYNMDQAINGACTIKAPFSWYVLTECQKNNISIWQEEIKYTDDMYDEGSGNIKTVIQKYYGFKDSDSESTRNRIIRQSGKKIELSYSIGYLLKIALSVSDNIAYRMLQQRFPMSKYRTEFLPAVNGQNLWAGQTFGQVTVRQRMNEWKGIYSYITSSERYSGVLNEYLLNTNYCYLVQGMKNWHSYYHKSGWCSGTSYNSACDVAIIDNQYMVIILTQDDTSQNAHTDVVKGFGLAVESYVSSVGGAKNLF